MPIFGFPRLLTRPWRNGRRGEAEVPGSIGRPRRRSRSACRPRYTRYAAPIHFSVTKTGSDASSTAARPAPEAAPQTTFPVKTPAAVRTPDRRPPTRVLRIVSAVSWPGVTMTITAVTKNAITPATMPGVSSAARLSLPEQLQRPAHAPAARLVALGLVDPAGIFLPVCVGQSLEGRTRGRVL